MGTRTHSAGSKGGHVMRLLLSTQVGNSPARHRKGDTDQLDPSTEGRLASSMSLLFSQSSSQDRGVEPPIGPTPLISHPAGTPWGLASKVRDIPAP